MRIIGSMLCAALAFALVSCQPATRVQARNAPSASALYLGVVFGDAEVAARLPELYPRGETVPLQLARLGQACLRFIQTTQPDFLSRLRRELTSGDPVRVEAALLETRRVTERALSAQGDLLEEFSPETKTWFYETEDRYVFRNRAVAVWEESVAVAVKTNALEFQDQTRLWNDTLVSLLTERFEGL
jgi:SdpC family antimicrobial peptide